jgi:hypothetical protein
MGRKKPVRHIVTSYEKDDGTHVRSYVKGSGMKVSEHKTFKDPEYLAPKSSGWTKIDEMHWRSNEDPDITVNIDKSYEYSGLETFLVYPAYRGTRIPINPSSHNSGQESSTEEAKREATKEAKRIMALPIESVRNFNWEMTDRSLAEYQVLMSPKDTKNHR